MKSKFNLHKYHRKSIRLKEYDYSQAGAYYVTIVTWHRECLFGEIVNKEMELSLYGEIVQKWWDELSNHFPNVETGAFIVMPNHAHGIIMITDRRGAVLAPHDNPNFNKIETPELNNEFIEQNEIMEQDISIKRGGPTCANIGTNCGIF